jgi:hypothetical protein
VCIWRWQAGASREYILFCKIEDRSSMNELTYGAFSAALQERHCGQRAPLQGSIEVTRRCPLECLHCYNNLPMGDLDARSR